MGRRVGGGSGGRSAAMEKTPAQRTHDALRLVLKASAVWVLATCFLCWWEFVFFHLSAQRVGKGEGKGLLVGITAAAGAVANPQ